MLTASTKTAYYSNVRAVYPKPNLSKPAKRAAKHPYLLKNKAIAFSNQVWSVDITYVPVGRSHMYLTCIIDWYSRYVVGWRLASDMGAAGVCECMRRALDEHGEPPAMCARAWTARRTGLTT